MACMAHIRRKFVDVQRSQGSAVAEEAIQQIARLHAIEKLTCRKPPVERMALRQEHARHIFDGPEDRLHAELPGISGKSPLARAIRHAPGRLQKARPYLETGDFERDNNSVERAMKLVAIDRKNRAFAGSEDGGKAMAFTLIETARLNCVDPQA